MGADDALPFRLRASDGVGIAGEVRGAQGAPTVLLLHGAGQTRRSWRRVADRLTARDMRVIAADMRGHGESDWSAGADYRYPRLISDVEMIVRHFGAPMILVGASIGGKIAMCAAALCATPIAAALILYDIAPRTDMPSMDRFLDGMRPPADGFADLEAAARALAAGQDKDFVPGSGERLRRSMRQDGDGRWHWHWDPAFMRSREQGTDGVSSLPYVEDAARRITVPTLLARGERSPIVTDAGVAAFRALLPQLELVTIAGAGHMLAGDQNDAFGERIEHFIASL